MARREPGADAVVPARVDEPASASTSRVADSCSKSMPVGLRDRRPSGRPRSRSPGATRSRRSSSSSPVQTVGAVADHVLVVHQVGDPGDRACLARAGSRSASRRARAAAAPGSASRGRRCRRTGCARRAAPRARSHRATIASVSAPRLKSYWARSSVCRRAVEERRDGCAMSGGCWPPSVRVRDLDALVHRPARRRPDRRRRRTSTGTATALRSAARGSPHISSRSGPPRRPARRRGARLSRRARLRRPVHLASGS